MCSWESLHVFTPHVLWSYLVGKRPRKGRMYFGQLGSRHSDKSLKYSPGSCLQCDRWEHWTLKLVGLVNSLHQATRSKELVNLFHNSAHIISYHRLLQVDTALAEKTLQTMDAETWAVTPPNFVHGRFIHFTCDNIDINDQNWTAGTLSILYRWQDSNMVQKVIWWCRT